MHVIEARTSSATAKQPSRLFTNCRGISAKMRAWSSASGVIRRNSSPQAIDTLRLIFQEFRLAEHHVASREPLLHRCVGRVSKVGSGTLFCTPKRSVLRVGLMGRVLFAEGDESHATRQGRFGAGPWAVFERDRTQVALADEETRELQTFKPSPVWILPGTACSESSLGDHLREQNEIINHEFFHYSPFTTLHCTILRGSKLGLILNYIFKQCCPNDCHGLPVTLKGVPPLHLLSLLAPLLALQAFQLVIILKCIVLAIESSNFLESIYCTAISCTSTMSDYSFQYMFTFSLKIYYDSIVFNFYYKKTSFVSSKPFVQIFSHFLDINLFN